MLLESIEAAGSICAHIAAKKLHQAVASFGECFASLEEAGMINDNLSQRLQRMVRFRNLLVHQYWEVSDKKVLKYARNDLQDFIISYLLLKAFCRYRDVRTV